VRCGEFDRGIGAAKIDGCLWFDAGEVLLVFLDNGFMPEGCCGGVSSDRMELEQLAAVRVASSQVPGKSSKGGRNKQ